MERTFAKFIDLTHEIHEGMLTFRAPWHPPVQIEQMGRIDTVGRETRKITLGTHTGTQIDAPLHFISGGKSIDQVPLDQLIGPVTILDFSTLAENAAVTKTMLETAAITERMIFRFGWSKHWNTDRFYKGYPYFSKEAAEYLVQRGVRVVGFDTPSPDDSRITLAGDVLGTPDDSPIHKIFLRAGVALLEYVANLDTVDDLTGWTLVALPLPIRGGDGSPARVLICK